MFLAVLAVLMALAVFVPCALFASGKWRPGRVEEPPPPLQDVQAMDPPERAAPEPPSYTVEQTWTRKTTNVAITWIRNGITRGRQGGAAKALPAKIEEGNDLDDEPDSPPSAVEPAAWTADVDVVHTPASPTSLIPRLVRRALPWQAEGGHDDLPRPAERVADHDVPQPAPPTFESVRVDDSPVPPPAGMSATDRPVIIDPHPVALEGVDMSDAPLVPSGDGSAVRLAPVSQLRTALATGGFSRLMAWLRAFRKASNNTLAQANEMHAQALLVARRTRNAHMQALQAFQAVQSDKLDRQMINQTWQMLQTTQTQAAAAAQLTRATAAFVVASGGQQPAVAAAVNALQRHAPIAAAIKSAHVEPVKNLDFYRQ
ncbi:hypothetical protein SAMN05421811_103149 [Nonomuraea wenchangensis]|uniref:Uncharacterized protein n=2 Tax=Nonomuraea wenchangensis TaxID=568860 RepID=A0A1I0EPW3_9ACTN|nr:hypothetical protein SAMN05421811_103149 [Nonomuraea wenchangensis]